MFLLIFLMNIAFEWKKLPSQTSLGRAVLESQEAVPVQVGDIGGDVLSPHRVVDAGAQKPDAFRGLVLKSLVALTKITSNEYHLYPSLLYFCQLWIDQLLERAGGIAAERQGIPVKIAGQIHVHFMAGNRIGQ